MASSNPLTTGQMASMASGNVQGAAPNANPTVNQGQGALTASQMASMASKTYDTSNPSSNVNTSWDAFYKANPTYTPPSGTNPYASGTPPKNIFGQTITPEAQGIQADVGNIVNDIKSKYAGTGENADQSATRRGTGIVSDIASIPFKVAADIIPGGNAVLEAPSDVINWLGDKIGNIKGLQEWAINNPKAVNSLMDVMGTASNLGNIAGSIAVAEGGAKVAPKVAETATPIIGKTASIPTEAISKGASAIRDKASSMAENGIKKDWSLAAETSKTGFSKAQDIFKNAQSQGHNIADTLTNAKLNPSDFIDKGQYATEDAANQLRADAVKSSQDILRPSLRMADFSTPRTPVSSVIDSAKASIRNDSSLTQETRDTLIGQLEKSQTALEKQYPQGMSLTDQLNEKITRDLNSKYNPLGDIASTNEATKNKAIADALRGSLDKNAPEGVPVKEFNAELAKQYQAADYLDAINNKKVPQGLISRGLKTGAKIAGASITHGLGGGLLATVGGYHLGGILETLFERMPNPFKTQFLNNLEKTNPEAFKTMTDYLSSQGRQAEMIGKLPVPEPLGTTKNPIITPAPTTFEKGATEAKTTSVNPKVGTQYVRDLKTGKMKIIPKK